MLDPDELMNTAAAFGVSEDQVRRDHLISHILSALGELDAPLLFFGGTALARTHLADPASGGRLSEDIDLCTSDRRDVATLLTDQLPRLLRREFPGCTWQPLLSSVQAVQPAQLVSLTVPTALSFVGMKTVAWMDRAAARDLYDLARSSERGAVTSEVEPLIRRITGWKVAPHCFASAPASEWQNALSHQTRHLPTAQQCLHTVTTAFASALEWDTR